MTDKYLQNLAFDKIAEMAAERAACTPAKEMLLQERPYTSVEDVRALLLQTDEMASLLLKNGNPHISSCEGADAAVRRASKNGILSMGELLAVAGALRNFSTLASWYHQDDERVSVLDDLFFTITPQPALEKDILDAILSDTEMADTASNELYNLRRKIRQAEGSVRDKLDGIVKNQNTSKYLQEAVVTIRNGRFVVPVRAEHRGDISGVIHDVSSTGSTLFVEPTAVVEANAKILQLRSQEQSEIDRILGEFSQRVAEIAPFFEASYTAMLAVDMRVAKAELGLSMDGVCPQVNEETKFSLVKARHPLLDKATVVPVDITLGEEYDTLVITGPNTGGKTVSLKTAGLLNAMAQTGYLIPAHDSSTVCAFEQILVDIGDEQSIEQSLSTFSGHIKNITEILRQVTSRSLVLLDELGAGTDPSEGAALAISIIERLRETSPLIMATTHYAEMKMFALETDGVQNAGSEFDVETLRPTYRLIVGVPGRSNAFLISEKLGIPEQVIENARAHMSTEQRRFETVLTQLEDLKLQSVAQQQEIEELKAAAGRQLEQAKEKRDALIKQGEQELAAAREKAKALSEDVQGQAYALMDEIKRIEKDNRRSNAQKAQRAREIAKKDAEILHKKAGAGAEIKVQNFVPLTSVAVGQEVYIPEMDKLATVSSKPDKAGLVEVRMGVIKTKMPMMKLAAPPKMEQKQKVRHTRGSGGASTGSSFGRSAGSEINLLGKTVDEAIIETDQFIDNAVMAGLEMVYIIHGRGTGALRSAIQQELRRNKSVKSFRLGRYGEGEDGVTVVEIK